VIDKDRKVWVVECNEGKGWFFFDYGESRCSARFYARQYAKDSRNEGDKFRVVKYVPEGK